MTERRMNIKTMSETNVVKCTYSCGERLFRVDYILHKYVYDIGRDVHLWFGRCAHQLVGLTFFEALLEHGDDYVLKYHGFDILTKCLVLETFDELEENITFLLHSVILWRKV